MVVLRLEWPSSVCITPGQKGTKRLVDQYGESLLCVRYRYDEQRRVRIKTVELVVDEKSWQPPFRFKDDDIVAGITDSRRIYETWQATVNLLYKKPTKHLI